MQREEEDKQNILESDSATETEMSESNDEEIREETKEDRRRLLRH